MIPHAGGEAQQEGAGASGASVTSAEEAAKISEVFAAVATQYSTCSSKKKGGTLGHFSPGQMVPAFDKVVFDTTNALGEVHGPIKTQFGCVQCHSVVAASDGAVRWCSVLPAHLFQLLGCGPGVL